LSPTPSNVNINVQPKKILKKLQIFTVTKTSVVLWAAMPCRDHSEHPSAIDRIILKWILGKQGWKVLIGFIWLGIGTGGGLL
jgi:hypothetical protein